MRIAAALATGNRVLVDPDQLAGLPPGLAVADDGTADHVLFDGTADALAALDQALAEQPGALVMVQTDLALHRLVLERAVSINTAAAGGNAELIMQAEA